MHILILNCACIFCLESGSRKTSFDISIVIIPNDWYEGDLNLILNWACIFCFESSSRKTSFDISIVIIPNDWYEGDLKVACYLMICEWILGN